MIQLRSDCLVFETQDGKCIPCGVADIAVQLVGESEDPATAEMLRHAALAVLHYFRDEVGRETITIGEFSQALEKALQGCGIQLGKHAPSPLPQSAPPGVETDLCQLAQTSGAGCELVFFPLLREALRAHLKAGAAVVTFHGLRECAKQLAGVRRWTRQCEQLSDQIVDFLSRHFSAEHQGTGGSLVVR
jgi:hypothetical protein